MGNFSRNPDTVLQDALGKGYNRVLFQQGKPVLDRELNLLADLVSPQRLIEQHIGNGVPDGSDGFRISNLDVAQNDFMVKAGRCLLGGYEIVLAADTTYKTQPHAENIAPLPAGTSYVYLRVFTSEVNGTQDSSLNNPTSPVNPDVGFETAVRKKVEWEVIVTTSGVTAQNHMILAVITKTPPTVTDRRRTSLTVSTLRDEVVAARGTQASLDARLDVSLNANGTLANGATVTGDLIVNNKLGIGTSTPQNKLDVEGGAVIGATYSGANTAPANGLLVEGNVGIGNTSPRAGAKLEVSSGSLFISQANDYVQIDPWVGSNGSSMAFYENSQQKANLYWHKPSQTFLVNSATPATNTVLNRNGGNVGIGMNTNPLAKLQVSGGAIMPAAGNSVSAGIQFPSDPGGGSGDAAFIRYFAESGETTKLLIGCTNDADDRISFYQFGAERLTIYNGNVGIGTASPAGKLDVNGDIYRAGLLAISGEAGGWLRINQNNDFPKGTHFARRANFHNGMTTGDWWDVEPGVGNLLVKGKVGIGMTNPDRTLDISGSMRASGEIQTNSPNALRMVFGNYGSFFRNDGADTYLLLTNPGDPYGDWNALRPIRINNISGDVFLGNLDVADNFTAEVRCADFKIGHSTRRGMTGRALVDYYPKLHINYGTDWTTVQVNGQFVNSSSREIKEGVRDMTAQEALEILLAMNPVKFIFKFDKEKRRQVGFIAEDVPDIIRTKDKKAIASLNIIGVLTKVVQEHQQAIQIISKRLAT